MTTQVVSSDLSWFLSSKATRTFFFKYKEKPGYIKTNKINQLNGFIQVCEVNYQLRSLF